MAFLVLKNHTHMPVTCVYNMVFAKKKKRGRETISIVIPLFIKKEGPWSGSFVSFFFS